MRIPRLLLVLPLAMCLTGCLSSYTLVKVKPDGAGTIEQTTLINPMMVGMMSGMAQGMAGEAGAKAKPPTVADMFKEEELRAAAANMGEGVTFVSSKAHKADGKEGVIATYAFTDITKVRVNQSLNKGAQAKPSGSTESPVVFGFAPGAGGSKVLSITMPEGKKSAGAKPAKPEGGAPDMKDMPPEALAMMKSMFAGAKIAIDVEVVGTLIKTNSPHVAGSKVTVMEVDLGALMEDPKKFQELQGLGSGASFEEAQKVLGDVKGVKIPSARTTTIEFR